MTDVILGALVGAVAALLGNLASNSHQRKMAEDQRIHELRSAELLRKRKMLERTHYDLSTVVLNHSMLVNIAKKKMSATIENITETYKCSRELLHKSEIVIEQYLEDKTDEYKQLFDAVRTEYFMELSYFGSENKSIENICSGMSLDTGKKVEMIQKEISAEIQLVNEVLANSSSHN